MIDDYFKEIDTSDKSYFLGMMFADGNIYKRKDRKETYRIQLKLKKEDKYLVEKFSDCIASHIKVRDEKDGSRLIFTNKAIALDLISQGCIPKKFQKNL